jgi:hypothetical protein
MKSKVPLVLEVHPWCLFASVTYCYSHSGCRLASEMEEGNTAAALNASGCPVLRSLRTRVR